MPEFGNEPKPLVAKASKDLVDDLKTSPEILAAIKVIFPDGAETDPAHVRINIMDRVRAEHLEHSLEERNAYLIKLAAPLLVDGAKAPEAFKKMAIQIAEFKLLRPKSERGPQGPR